MTHDNHEGTKLHGMGVTSQSRLDTHDRGKGAVSVFSAGRGLQSSYCWEAIKGWMRRSLRINSSIRTAYGQADSLLDRLEQLNHRHMPLLNFHAYDIFVVPN